MPTPQKKKKKKKKMLGRDLILYAVRKQRIDYEISERGCYLGVNNSISLSVYISLSVRFKKPRPILSISQ